MAGLGDRVRVNETTYVRLYIQYTREAALIWHSTLAIPTVEFYPSTIGSKILSCHLLFHNNPLWNVEQRFHGFGCISIP